MNNNHSKAKIKFGLQCVVFLFFCLLMLCCKVLCKEQCVHVQYINTAVS